MVEDQKRDTLLFAGLLQVRITDWFFFKDKADLKYIGLENAVIKLQRTDSVWNYTFLEQYFASSSTDTTTKKKAGISFNLKQVVFKNVYLLQKDAWLGRDMAVRIGGMLMDANEISDSKKIIDIPGISLRDPVFTLHDYTGNRPDSLKSKSKPKLPSTDSMQWNIAGWDMQVGKINIENGRFKNDKGDGAAVAYFDSRHIDFTAISGTVENFRWSQDTIRANISLSTKERSGLIVQALRSDLRFHPKLMEFNDLTLETNGSILKNYFAMKYETIDNMNNFIHDVSMEGRFEGSYISSDDLAFFAPAIKDWNRNILIDGNIRGAVDDLAAKNLTLQIGKDTYINGDATVVGLPDINSTYIDAKANDLRTTYNDAVRLIPAIRDITTPDLRSLSYLRFKGNYTGFLSDFVTYGTLQTNLGTLVTDLNMKLPANGTPVYSGNISTDGFQFGKFIRSPTLGLIDFKGEVKGKGFKWDNSLDISINGFIDRIQYESYTYQNIKANGRLNNRMFNGDFLINDPNADLHLVGLIDLRGKQPLFNASADINYANLRVLQLSKDDLVLTGKFDVDFSGSSLSEFLGTARIHNATLLQNGSPLSFDSLLVTSQYIDGIKTFRATSNELDATIKGNFNLETLPDAFLLFLNRYYPAYIKPPGRMVQPQSFSFNIKTGVIENYIKLVDKRLSGFNNSTIIGSLDVANNLLTVRADVPQFAYDQYQFSDVILKGDGNLEHLKIEGQVNNTVITDSLRLPQTTFSIEAKNDISDVSIATTANQTINQANLSAQLRTFSNGFALLLNPSTFVINGKTWNIEQGGELDFRRNSVVSGQVVIKESNQEVRLTTQPSDIGSWNDLSIKLSNLNLGDVTPIFVKTNRIEGLLSGDITVEDPQNRFNVTSNLRTDHLRVDNDSIGQVQTSINYNNQTGLLSGSGNTLNPDQKLSFDLSLDFKDTANLHRDRITVQPVHYPVKILERFIGNLFSDLQGDITGRLDIVGEGSDRDYIGKATLRNAGLKVDFTQVFYTIEDTEIELKEDGIYFGTMKLHDRFKNTAILEGHINHKGFSNMYFDILVQVESRQMELLNTSYNDNQQFYGRALGSGTFILVGEQDDMIMDIRVAASETDSSYITLPPSRTRESGQASFMVEKQYGREMSGDELGGSASNISYTVNLNSNPLVNMEVVLDELTGDIIRGRGTGNLFISSGTNEPLSIRGRYEIEEGSYLFTFQSFFKKPFTLRSEGNNYIDWTGDPYGATIHFDAIYTAERVSFAPLAGENGVFGGANKNYANIREDVNVVATLTGELFTPKFNFRLEFPRNSEAANDPTIAFGIQQIEKNENELNKQVTYLIVFNSFAPYEAAQFTTGTALNEFAYSTISGLFFGEVNKRLNQLLSKVLRNNDLTFNFSGSLYNRNLVTQDAKGFNINQSNLNLSVGVPLFSDRFILTFGSTFDIPITSDIEQNIQFLPDVTAQWLINKSGSVRATFFYRQNLDFIGMSTTTGTGLVTTRTGANISYRKDFDHIGKPKGKLKTKPAMDSTSTPPSTEDSTQTSN